MSQQGRGRGTGAICVPLKGLIEHIMCYAVWVDLGPGIVRIF